MFSRACEYAIKIMFYIAENEKKSKRTGLKEVTDAIDSPVAFTAKILQILVKSKLLSSFKGPNGGFELVKKNIKMVDIVKAIDGNKILENCVLGLPECSGQNPCLVHDKFLAIRTYIKETLLAVDIRDQTLYKLKMK